MLVIVGFAHANVQKYIGIVERMCDEQFATINRSVLSTKLFIAIRCVIVLVPSWRNELGFI